MTTDERVDAPMTEADVRFAERLAEDVQRVLGLGLVVESINSAGRGPVTLRATCLVEGRPTELEVEGETLLDASRALIRAAAELRLGAAWTRLVAPI